MSRSPAVLPARLPAERLGERPHITVVGFALSAESVLWAVITVYTQSGGVRLTPKSGSSWHVKSLIYHGRRNKMIKTERGTTTMNGSLEELIKDYLIILAVFKEKMLAGTFTYIEDVEEVQVMLQEAADIPCDIINEHCLDADAVEVVYDAIKEICEDFRDYHADLLNGFDKDAEIRSTCESMEV